MKSLRITLAALSLSAVSSLALAAGNPLSVHVLNLENGLPSPGVNVTLEKHVGKDWQPLAQGVTNEQGRIGELFRASRRLKRGSTGWCSRPASTSRTWAAIRFSRKFR
jgi:5-hydroxyisourate hydrolase